LNENAIHEFHKRGDNVTNKSKRIPLTKAKRRATLPTSLPVGEKTVDLNFKVTADFHRKFKIEAITRGMFMLELLKTCFGYYVRKFPSKLQD
jgi:hypothetical protein